MSRLKVWWSASLSSLSLNGLSLNRLALAVAVTAFVSSGIIVGVATAKDGPKTIELKALKDVTWAPLMKEGPLPALAPIQGDVTKGSFAAYLKLPANFTSPPHKHSSDYWQVLVQGKMTHWAAEGGSEKDAKQLGVGDLTFMPAKVEHISKCYPGADCIAVLIQKAKFDFIPTKPTAAPPAEPAKK